MNKDSENATMELRNFKKTGFELIKSCQIRNVIDPLLADHVAGSGTLFVHDSHAGTTIGAKRKGRTAGLNHFAKNRHNLLRKVAKLHNN